MKKNAIITTLDQVTTAAELVALVSWQGVSTKPEDIGRMQDIIGHSTIEELDRLANDHGQCDMNGNPDPNGTWSSGRRGTRDTFYHLLSIIWNWQDLMNFWNEHTNPDHFRVKELEEKVKKAEAACKRFNEDYNELRKGAEELSNHKAKLTAVAMDQKNRLEAQAREIMEFKAKLYDLMVKENGAA